MHSKLRVLISGRDATAAYNLGARLATAAVDFEWVENARDARHALATQTYDAVLLDLILADQDSISLARELRGRELRVPLLITSLRSAVPTESRLRAAIQSHWLNQSADQARAIFAIKIATQRRPAYRPHILSLSPVVTDCATPADALRICADVDAVNDLADATALLSENRYDLALLDPATLVMEPADRMWDFAAIQPSLPVVLHHVYRVPEVGEAADPALETLIRALRTYAMLGHEQPLRAHG